MATKNDFGKAEFRWQGGSAPWVVRSAIADAMERGAIHVKRTMRRLISIQGPPRSKPNDPPHKDSGDLYKHIGYVINRQTLTAQIGPGPDEEHYGHYLEFGTTKMEPRPFMMRALQEEGKKLMNIINRAAVIAFNKHARSKGKR